jgi:hypothetical protein
MEYSDKDKILLKRYLLGWLEEEEQQQVEDHFVTDTGYFQELLMLEDELVDLYISGALSDLDRAKFEQYFLATTERQQKLEFAKALKKYIGAASVKGLRSSADNDEGSDSRTRIILPLLHTQKPILGFSLAVLLTIIIFGTSWLIVKKLWLQNPAEQTSGSVVITATLSSGVLRGTGDIKRIAIADGVSTVRLSLELVTGEYQSYHAVVQTDKGYAIFTASELKPEKTETGRAVILDLPARLLNKGDYQINLSGLVSGEKLEDVGRYYFRVSLVDS